MVGFIESASGAVKNLFCDALRGGSNFVGLFPDNLATDAITGVLDGASLNLCNRGGGSSGGGGAGGEWSGGTVPPQFTGGQCEGVTYSVNWRQTWTGSAPPFNTRLVGSNVIGAIEGVFSEQTGATSEDYILHNGGQKTYVGGPVSGTITISELTVSRLDGLPDTCGDLPSERPPSIEELDETIPEIAYDDIDGNPVSLPNVPIKFFKPCINLDGIRIPFEIDTPFGKVCGKIGISGDIPNIVEPSIDIDLCPSQKTDLGLAEPDIEEFFDVGDQVGVSVSSDFDGVLNEGNAIPEKPIMGVFINSKNKGNNYSQTILLNDDINAPKLIAPNIGYVQFQYLIQTSGEDYETAFSSDIPIKFSQQFIPCPSEHGAISVSVVWDKKWEGNYRVARRKSCCDACKNVDPNNPPLDKLDRCRLD